PTTARPASTATSTALNMFDWMNPNKNKDDAETKKEEEPSNDFFGNMFKINTTPTKQHDIDDASHHAEPAAAASTAEPEIEIVKPADKVEKKEDFVAEAFNNLELEEAVKEEKIEEAVSEVKEKIPVKEPTPAVVATTQAPTKKTEAATAIEGIVADGKTIHHGRVRWFYPKKGFGFVSPVDAEGNYLYPKKDDSRDIFVHQSDIDTKGVDCHRYLFNRELVDFKAIKDKQGRIKAAEVTGRDGSPTRCVQQKLNQEKEAK
ncbi:MAG: hypothetical protein SGILL_008703, partial [Bacillariaceae sp.]